LLRRFEANALAAMATGLDLTAQALDGDVAVAERAIASQRELRDELSELARIRRASARVARHSLAWRGHVAPVVRENEDAGQLDLLGGSCLLLTRTSLEAGEDEQRLFAPCVSALATVLGDLAEQPGDQATRQRAVDRSLEILREMRTVRADPEAEVTTVLAAARVAVTDLLFFAGVDPDEARAATREGRPKERELEVPAPAAARKGWFRLLRGWFRSLGGR
jgi:hypothetical protein